MISYIERRTISNDCGKIFQNYFVPFFCLLKCASFSGNTSWASSYGAFEQCEFIMKNFVKVPIGSFNNFLNRFGFRWDVVTKKFMVVPFYRDYEITLEELDIFNDVKNNVAVSAVMTLIHRNSEILSTRYLSSRANLILSVISIHMNEISNIFENNTLNDILLEYVDVLPKKRSVGF